MTSPDFDAWRIPVPTGSGIEQPLWASVTTEIVWTTSPSLITDLFYTINNFQTKRRIAKAHTSFKRLANTPYIGRLRLPRINAPGQLVWARTVYSIAETNLRNEKENEKNNYFRK